MRKTARKMAKTMSELQFQGHRMSSQGKLKDIPKKTNCAQKSTTPKNGKFAVTRSRKVLRTLGVQTFLAAGWSVASEQGMMWFEWSEQSGCSPGWRRGWSQKVWGP